MWLRASGQIESYSTPELRIHKHRRSQVHSHNLCKKQSSVFPFMQTRHVFEAFSLAFSSSNLSSLVKQHVKDEQTEADQFAFFLPHYSTQSSPCHFFNISDDRQIAFSISCPCQIPFTPPVFLPSLCLLAVECMCVRCIHCPESCASGVKGARNMSPAGCCRIYPALSPVS